jgi:hypothetical protein
VQQQSITKGNSFQISILRVAATWNAVQLELALPRSLSTAIRYDTPTMPTCRGCGRQGLKRSGINQHCRRSRNPRCQEYLTHLKQANIRNRVHRAQHSPTPTLNVSPSNQKALNPDDNPSKDLERTVQMTFVNNLVSSATNAPAHIPEDHNMDIPCEA